MWIFFYVLDMRYNLMFSLFCSQALSMCCLKHCVALWQLLASLKSENMLRLKRVRHQYTETEMEIVLLLLFVVFVVIQLLITFCLIHTSV